MAKNKLKISIMIIITISMLTSLIFASNFTAQAQEYTNMQDAGSIRLPAGVTPDFSVPTELYLSFRPNPIGVGQNVLINIWSDPPLHASRYHTGYKVIITRPSGQVETVELNSYRGDATSWTEYWVNEVGTWTIEFEFLGSYFPAGNYSVPEGTAVWLPRVVNFPESAYYEPATTGPMELVVQEDMVYSWPPTDLPDEYWTRPVAFENREWSSMLGNFPWRGPGGGPDWPAETNPYYSNRYDFIPYVTGPETAHIVWRRQDAISGIVGGDIPGFQMTTKGSDPSIVYCGRCYGTRTKVVEDGTTQRVWECYDLRTGEVYWEKTGVTQVPSYIEYDEGAGEIPGGAGRAFGDIGYVSLLYIGGGRMIKYDPFTGNVGLNVSIAPMTSGIYYMNKHVLSVQNLGGGEYRLINWTTAGQPAGFGALARNYAIISNTSYAMRSLPTLQDWSSGYGASYTTNVIPALGGYYGSTIRGYDLMTGEMLWENTIDDTIYSGSCTVADHGKVALLMKGGYFLCFDLRTGNHVWKSDLMDYPWGEASFGGYSQQSAYGMLFRESYDGVYAFDWDDGSIAWKYEDPANPFETPYINEDGESVYSFDSNAWVADGKLYTINNEHTPTAPITRGWGVNCIDAFTGEQVWKIEGIWVWGGPGPIVDGYMTVRSSDGYTYAFGKGPTKTTLSASPKVSVHGTSVLLEGSVFDISPGATGAGVIERFPNGLPAVDDESVSPWMEYVYLQQRLIEDVNGVPVKLEAIDPNFNYQDLGTATTDINGNFGFAFEPEVPGTYMIIATFYGSDDYYSSSQTTYITVDEAPAPATPIEPEEPSPPPVTPPEPEEPETPTEPEEPIEPEEPETPTEPEEPTEPEQPAEAPLITTEIAILIAVAVASIVGIGAFWYLRKK